MRGKAGEAWQKNNQSRITPAYAGKSGFIHDRGSCDKDHPRLCGEKVCIIQPIVIDRRITPAYAGKSAILFRGFFILWDHPRLCGEKIRRSVVYPHRRGSPPPMRGKGIGETAYEGNARITPAYAGKRSILYDAIDTMRDHPRLCGEKAKETKEFSGELGSPPPMRGKGTYMDETISIYRITPAYAGKR